MGYISSLLFSSSRMIQKKTATVLASVVLCFRLIESWSKIECTLYFNLSVRHCNEVESVHTDLFTKIQAFVVFLS